MKRLIAFAGLLAILGCGSSGHGGGSLSAASTASTPAPLPVPAATQPTTPAVTAPVAPVAPVAPGPASVTNPHLIAALAQLNADRAKYGAGPLQLDAAMCVCALRHSTDLYNCCGGAFGMIVACAHKDFAAGDTCGGFAENQGAASGPDIDQAFLTIDASMMAEGPVPPGGCNHFGNITNPKWTYVGIGLYQDSNLNVWLTEDFR
jgi:hypothetical protein